MSGFDYLRESIGTGSRFIPAAQADTVSADQPTPDVETLARREARKYGTDSPHEPTDEFVVQAFAEGARYLWPDSRDPGWHVTFRRWLAADRARERAEGAREALLEAANSFPTGSYYEWIRARLRDRANKIGENK